MSACAPLLRFKSPFSTWQSKPLTFSALGLHHAQSRSSQQKRRRHPVSGPLPPLLNVHTCMQDLPHNKTSASWLDDWHPVWLVTAVHTPLLNKPYAALIDSREPKRYTLKEALP